LQPSLMPTPTIFWPREFKDLYFWLH